MAILTISREFRSGSQEIGMAVTRELNYRYVAKEQLLQDMKAAGERWERAVQQMDEVIPSYWERYDWEYQGFIALVELHVFEYALRNNVVIVGRGGNHLLQGVPHAFRVRLTAPKEKRVERVMLKDGLDRKAAEVLLDRIDRNRAGHIQINYKKSWDNAKDFDMVLNTGVQSLEECTKILVDALRQRDRKATAAGFDLLRGRALAARVKAGVLTDRRFHIPTLTVSFEEGIVVLRGVVHNAAEHRTVEELAQQTASPAKVRCELHYRQ